MLPLNSRKVLYHIKSHLSNDFLKKSDKMIENILFAHAYEPWYVDRISGRENVIKCLSDCYEYVKPRG